MDDLERRKVLNRLTKSALVDLVLIQLQPGFNQNLTLDNLLLYSAMKVRLLPGAQTITLNKEDYNE